MRWPFLAIPLLASAATPPPTIIDETRLAVAQGNFAAAEAGLQSYRARNGVTPEMIEALSWAARGALAAKQLDKADAYAKETEQMALTELKKRPLDADEHLPTALGAAIETQAMVLDQRGQRNDAVSFLTGQLIKFGGTSIATRIQKDINLLSLEGKPAPPLQETEFLGPKPVSLTSLRGHPVLLFFWAHWCPDCKADEPLIAQVKSEYAAKGLVVIGPTQRYGYVAGGEDATPEAELKYIDQVRHQYYRDLLDVSAPVSEQNFKRYGASSTPTLVLIDRRGIVRLYHPGKMTLEELRTALDRVAGASSTARAGS